MSVLLLFASTGLHAMALIHSKIEVKQSAVDAITSLDRTIREKVFPRVLAKVAAPIKASMVAKLPDGQASGTRAKQSKKTRARFPHSITLKRNVGRKTISDTLGVLLLTGVTTKAGHVRFDHGDKAKTTGRVHKLWWIDGVREVYATPMMRKQSQDISLLVHNEFAPKIERIVVDELRSELRRINQ